MEASLVSTTERITDSSPMSLGTPIIDKKCSARKLLHLFTEVLNIKDKNSVLQIGDAKSKRKSIRARSMLSSSIPQRRVHTKINEQVNKYAYNCILQHPQVVQCPIFNHCLKVSIDGHSEPQLVKIVTASVCTATS